MFASLPSSMQETLLAELAVEAEVSPAILKAALIVDWRVIRRPKQRPPVSEWTYWLLKAGRGFGKTITAAQWVREKALERSYQRGALVAPTFGDGRDTMVEGETGLLEVFREHELRGGERATAWNRSTGELFLANGTKLKVFSSEEPDRLRGPQHHFLWGEEVSSWKDAHKGDVLQTTWSNAKLGCRLGDNPQFVLTSTPKLNKLTKELLALPAPEMVIVGGSSFENRDNLSAKWWDIVIKPYIGTRLGLQEIEGQMLEDVEGALWKRAQIDALRVAAAPDLKRVVVGVDPNTSSEQGSNAAGIIVVGLGHNDHGYVIADRTTVEGGPAAWSQGAVDAYHEFEADSIVAEKNQGGDMVKMVMRAAEGGAHIPIKLVQASRGKRTRAEPIALFYDGNETNDKRPDPGRVHHVGDPANFMDLEEEMVTWTPGMDSPDRMDALVWGLSELMLKQQGGGVILEPTGIIPGLGTGRGVGDGYDRSGGDFSF